MDKSQVDKAFLDLRTECKSIIDANLKTDNFLNIKEFRRFHQKMYSVSDLKFYKYYPPTEKSIECFENNILGCRNPKFYNDIYEGMVASKESLNCSIQQLIDKACDSVSVACFSEVWDNLLMYAHYTDSFKGFCLEYDFKKMIGPIPYFFPVLYQEKPSSIAKMLYLSELIDRSTHAITNRKINLLKIDDLVSYFIHKSDIWSYEREWRFIVPISHFNGCFKSANLYDEYHIIENFDCVSAIYLGAKIDSNKGRDIRQRLIDIVKKKNEERAKIGSPNIIVYQTQIKDETYDLERIRVY